jgi:DNA-directed RNA polymerase III subunit RPC6
VDPDSSPSGSEGIGKKRKVAGKRQGGGTTTSSESEEDHRRKKTSKKAQSSRERRRKRKRDPEDADTSDGGRDEEIGVKRRKKQKTDDHRVRPEGEGKSRHFPSTSKANSGGRSKLSEPDYHSETGSSASDSDSEEESKAAHSLSNPRKSNMSSQPKRRAHARSRSPLAPLDDKIFGSAYVYRAVRQERVALGWSQAPCGSCPVFDFCKEGGPVGPSGCEYYGEWLKRAAIAMDS